MNLSDTPKTDAHWEEQRSLDRGRYITKDFAQQLERHNNQLRQQLTEALAQHRKRRDGGTT